MSSKDVHAAFPAQNFHPEFGYLCPSARMRRKARSAAMTFLAGMVVAAGTALALVPQLVPLSAGDGVRADPALMVATAVLPIDKATNDKAADDKAVDGKAADEGVAVTAAPLRRATDRFVRPRAQTPCDDLSGSFLSPQCQFGKAVRLHLAHAARAEAGHRVANVSIGRASLEGEQQGAPRAAPAAVATALAANEDSPVLPPAKPAKKVVKAVPKPAPSRDTASADTVASAPQPGFDLFGLFHQPSRTGNGGTGSGPLAMFW
jgi:hypothetical protein